MNDGHFLENFTQIPFKNFLKKYKKNSCCHRQRG